MCGATAATGRALRHPRKFANGSVPGVQCSLALRADSGTEEMHLRVVLGVHQYGERLPEDVEGHPEDGVEVVLVEEAAAGEELRADDERYLLTHVHRKDSGKRSECLYVCKTMGNTRKNMCLREDSMYIEERSDNAR